MTIPATSPMDGGTAAAETGGQTVADSGAPAETGQVDAAGADAHSAADADTIGRSDGGSERDTRKDDGGGLY
jgi:hypothetical protein